MIVVCDTSPLNYLILIHHAHLLPALSKRVAAPPAVVAEPRHPGSPVTVRAWAATPPKWLEVHRPTSIDPGVTLGAGETEAICLAQELKAAVLIDERKAAAVARQRGLLVTGTLGVLQIGSEGGLVNLREAIELLQQTSFRVSEPLLNEMLQRDEDRQRSASQEGGQSRHE